MSAALSACGDCQLAQIPIGGIVRCDRVANGVVKAINELGLSVPVVVRLEGTNAVIAKEILSKSNVNIIPALDLKDAAQKVVSEAIKK